MSVAKDRASRLRVVANYDFGGPDQAATREAILAGAEALEAQDKPKPMVLAEAWIVVEADGRIAVDEEWDIGDDGKMFQVTNPTGPLFVGPKAEQAAKLTASPPRRPVRVHIVRAVS